MIKKKPIVFFRLDKREREKVLDLTNINLTYAHDTLPSDEEMGIQTVERISGNAKDVGHILQNILNAKSNFIIIDEYVFFKFRQTKLLREAIVQAKRMRPELYIILWNSALLTSKAAKFVRDYVDMVFLETYWSWKSKIMMWLFFKVFNYRNLKKYDIVDKAMFVLGINDNKEKRREDFPGDLWGSIPWANDPYTLVTQMFYIKEKCQGTQGIGFFVKGRASNFMIQMADSLAGQIFVNW